MLSGVSEVTIARFEAGSTLPRIETIAKLQEAIEREGVQIITGNPAGGYTLVVSEKAVQLFADSRL